MVEVVVAWLANNIGFKKGLGLAAKSELVGNDEALLTYYTACQISPSINDENYRNTEEIHNLLAFRVISSVFGPDTPDFGQQQTRVIIRKALWMARLKWQTVEDDFSQAEFKRVYATHMIADIDMRLEAVDLPKPQ